ncbi:MAG: ATP-binding protein, partial [Desulfotomaculaceae bacterium]
SQFVPLKSEIELAKAYIEIEKARFEERIEVTLEAPDDLETRVPNLMLQPLIENAVIHGILPKPEGGRIDISVNREGRTLIFRVKDNGIGMAADKLNGNLKHNSLKGVGLANIDSRLRKLFGKGLHIKSGPGTGTEITWRIPL